METPLPPPTPVMACSGERSSEDGSPRISPPVSPVQIRGDFRVQMTWYINTSEAQTESAPEGGPLVMGKQEDEVLIRILPERQNEPFGGFGRVVDIQFPEKPFADKIYAAKFFGYTKNKPDHVYIQKEINNMVDVSGVKGCVQIFCVFRDKIGGMLKHLVHRKDSPFLVIVMEKAGKYDLIDWLPQYKKIEDNWSLHGVKKEGLCVFSEAYLASLFRSFIMTLYELQKKNIIHRDLKLENTCHRDDHTFCLIDVGSMIKLPEGKHYVVDTRAGTTMYAHAPEVVDRGEYSFASDIYAAGVTLYSLLSRALPFRQHNPPDDDIRNGNYVPMKGGVWEMFSMPAKQLVAEMMSVNASERPTCEFLLTYNDWLRKDNCLVPKEVLGEKYFLSWKNWLLRKTFRKIFLSPMAVDFAANITKKFEEKFKTDVNFFSLTEEYFQKFQNAFRGAHDDVATLGFLPYVITRDRQKFVEVMSSVNCPMTTKSPHSFWAEMFDVCDWNGDDLVDYKECMLTLAVFREDKTQDCAKNAKLFFDILDTDNSNVICKDALVHVVSLMFADHEESEMVSTAALQQQIHDLFDFINTKNDGSITREEFQVFYELLHDYHGTNSHSHSSSLRL